MTFSTESPFNGVVPPTVKLPETPLTGVLAQMRFPEILSIAKVEYVAEFQERVRAIYPLHHQDHNVFLEFDQEGSKQKKLPIWRFFDEHRQWRISLSTSFIALETRAYKDRNDFVERLHFVLDGLAQSIKPTLISRLGVRYVDRIYGDKLDRLNAYVRPEIRGMFNNENAPFIERTFSEIVVSVDVGKMTSRSGFIPENQTHDPDLMPPISRPSWFLDIDVFQEFRNAEKFVPDDAAQIAMRLATRAYGFFRWAVSDEFLRLYGGKL